MSEEKKMVAITATFDVSVDDILRESEAEALEDAIRGELGWVHDSGMFLRDWDYLHENEYPNGDKDGVCPVCGEHIDYEDREVLDDDCVCSWHCRHCGASGKMAESIVFDQHFDIVDRDGNRVLEGRDEGIDGATKLKLAAAAQASEAGSSAACESALKRTLAEKRKELETALFIHIIREAIVVPGQEDSSCISATSLYSKYARAVESHGTWLMAQEAASAIADLLEKGAISLSELIAMDDAPFLKELQQAAETSFENALENASHGASV